MTIDPARLQNGLNLIVGSADAILNLTGHPDVATTLDAIAKALENPEAADALASLLTRLTGGPKS